MKCDYMTRSIGNVNTTASTKSPTYTTYTSGSGTYSSPAGCSFIIVDMCGAGSGGGCGAAITGGGGGGGGYAKVKMVPGTYSYSVGAAGSGTSVAGNDGFRGGATTFGSNSAYSGDVGAASGFGGFGNDTNIISGTALIQITGTYGGSSGTTTDSSAGGLSFYGTAPVVQNQTRGNFKDGNGYGCGGAGICILSSGRSGDGSGGIIAITEFY